MARRNIANRQDIAADALRQRRDLYALAIGLTVFHLAGGTISANTCFGSILPVSLARPWVFEVAAWIGFFYFWIRFWLISEGKPFEDFVEDARWQAGDQPALRRLACKFIVETHYQSAESSRAQLLDNAGPVPRLGRNGRVPTISLDGISARSRRREGMGSNTFGLPNGEVLPADRPIFWRCWAKGWFLATFRERSFTDYTLPHLFALLTVFVGVYAWASAAWAMLSR